MSKLKKAPAFLAKAMPMSGSRRSSGCTYLKIMAVVDIDTGLSNAQTTQVWEDVFINAMVSACAGRHLHPHASRPYWPSQTHHRSLPMPALYDPTRNAQARAFANSGGSQSGWIGEKFWQAGMPGITWRNWPKYWASRSSEGMSMPTMVQAYGVCRTIKFCASARPTGRSSLALATLQNTLAFASSAQRC